MSKKEQLPTAQEVLAYLGACHIPKGSYAEVLRVSRFNDRVWFVRNALQRLQDIGVTSVNLALLYEISGRAGFTRFCDQDASYVHFDLACVKRSIITI